MNGNRNKNSGKTNDSDSVSFVQHDLHLLTTLGTLYKRAAEKARLFPAKNGEKFIGTISGYCPISAAIWAKILFFVSVSHFASAYDASRAASATKFKSCMIFLHLFCAEVCTDLRTFQ